MFFLNYSQQTLTTLSPVLDKNWVTDNENLISQATTQYENLEKCPTCFIIFTPDMGTIERSRHVNQHFEDI